MPVLVHLATEVGTLFQEKVLNGKVVNRVAIYLYVYYSPIVFASTLLYTHFYLSNVWSSDVLLISVMLSSILI